MKNKDIVFSYEKITQVFNDNVTDILKDVLTGWNSPIKKIFTEDEEFKKQLQGIAKSVLTEVMSDPKFTEQLKEQLIQEAVKGLISR
jgi:hypothetical protein